MGPCVVVLACFLRLGDRGVLPIAESSRDLGRARASFKCVADRSHYEWDWLLDRSSGRTMVKEPENTLDVSVGFSTTNKISSRIIRWLTHAPCSHAWVAFYDETLEMRMVLQAEWWGFELRPWARWVKENILVAEYVSRELDLDPAVRFLSQELGGRYDFGSAFWVGLKGWVRRWFRARLTLRPSRTPRQLMCSEAVARGLAHAGFPFPTYLDLETVSPGELLITCSRSSLFKPKSQ